MAVTPGTAPQARCAIWPRLPSAIVTFHVWRARVVVGLRLLVIAPGGPRPEAGLRRSRRPISACAQTLCDQSEEARREHAAVPDVPTTRNLGPLPSSRLRRPAATYGRPRAIHTALTTSHVTPLRPQEHGHALPADPVQLGDAGHAETFSMQGPGLLASPVAARITQRRDDHGDALDDQRPLLANRYRVPGVSQTSKTLCLDGLLTGAAQVVEHVSDLGDELAQRLIGGIEGRTGHASLPRGRSRPGAGAAFAGHRAAAGRLSAGGGSGWRGGPRRRRGA